MLKTKTYYAWPEVAGWWDKCATTTSEHDHTSGDGTVNIEELTLPLLANSTYEFELHLQHKSDDTNGSKFTMAFSGAGATAFWVIQQTLAATTLTSATGNTLGTLSAASCTGGTVEGVVLYRGHVVVGANAGNLTAQMAKQTASTGHIRAGATLKVRKVA